MRIWNGSLNDEGGVHAIGNGEIITYGRGPNMVQIFGPPYGSEVSCGLYINTITHCESQRRRGSAIWDHTLFLDGQPVATMTDYCGEGAVLIREIESSVHFTFTLGADECIERIYDNLKDEEISSSVMMVTPPGGNVFERIVSPYEQYMQVFTLGNTRVMTDPYNTLRTTTIEVGKGKSAICFAGGHNIIESYALTRRVIDEGIAKNRAHFEAYWASVMKKLEPVMASISDVPEKDRIVEAIENVAVIIKTQQCIEGGVLAGFIYHLVYVRDCYGVLRCLLELGLHDDAKAMMAYYLDIFRRKGEIHNAQGPGVDGFHEFENEATEITGYLYKSGWDYYKYTQDEAFLMEMLPMLMWSLDELSSQLYKNMVPFNGDETYIAGGIYPRTAIDHGSAESTMLLIFGLDLLDWLDKYGMEKDWSRAMRAKIEAAKADFLDNFVVDGKYYTNNPDRFNFDLLPKYRIGACIHPGHSGKYHWLERNSKGAYMCPGCYEEDFAPNMQRHQVKSTNLLPLYFHWDMVPREVLEPMVKSMTQELLSKGYMSSKDGTEIAVGYDFGMLLYNAVELGLDATAELAKITLDLVDDTGAWVEYYFDGVPGGCKYRPWESGINLDALLRYGKAK